jgi:enoyl-CoA hydratase/carnithine racemase
MSDTVVVERCEDIATVVLDRPQKLNALTKNMWERLGDVMLGLAADDSLRCVVLRGAGERAFSPGNDISEFERERADTVQARAYGEVMRRTLDALAHCRHPVVALIHGVCVGGGLEIAAQCDLRVCGRSSRFGIPINRLGLVMSLPELHGLIGLVGRSVTLEILLEGRVFGAEEARDKGLVSRVVDDAEVDEEAMRAARRIADGAPLVARWHKKFVNRFADPAPWSEQEIGEGFACYDTEDFKIGCDAFLDKKKPEFIGR